MLTMPSFQRTLKTVAAAAAAVAVEAAAAVVVICTRTIPGALKLILLIQQSN